MEMVHFIPASQRRLALLAVQADAAPVLVLGGSGSGKGAIARWIHSNGARSACPFLVAQQGKSLTEQILAAQSGTLMIPEMGEWTFSDQAILLNFLRTKTIPHPQDKKMSVLANVRIIGTTSQSLDGLSSRHH